MFGELDKVPEDIRDGINISQSYNFLNESIYYSNVKVVIAYPEKHLGSIVDLRALSERKEEKNDKIRNPLFSSLSGTIPVLLASRYDPDSSISWTEISIM